MNVALASECLVAVTGVYPSGPVTAAQANEAERIPRVLARAVVGFLDSTSPAKPQRSPKINYLSVWRRLNKKQDDDKLVVVIDDPQIGDAYLAKLEEARGYLREQWQPVVVKTLLGETLVEPPPSEQGRCQDLFAIVNDPRLIMGRISSGCILADEIEALSTVYPEFMGVIGTMIEAELLQRLAKRKSYECPYRQEVAIRALMGESAEGKHEIVAPEKGESEEGAEPPSLEISTSRRKEDSMTKTDRVSGGVAA